MGTEVPVRDRRVVVTGGSKGLGAALVRACIDRGAAKVWALSRSGKAPAADSIGIRCNVADLNDIKIAVRELSTVDVLINNAAVAVAGPLLGRTADTLLDEMRVNYLGPVLLVQQITLARKWTKPAFVLNIASQMYDAPAPVLPNYCASKSALVAASRCLGVELAVEGVRVVAACPGAIATDMSAAFPGKKQSPNEAAAEILDICGGEEAVVPIGPAARRLFTALRPADPVGASAARQQKLKKGMANTTGSAGCHGI